MPDSRSSVQLAGRSACTACGACAAVCAVGAITLREDRDGFPYPEIDRAKCVACGACRAACPALQPVVRASVVPRRHYAAKLRDRDRLGRVSSGGAFLALAQTVVAQGGVVYGAAREPDGQVRHKRADNLADVLAFCRSKYLPSLVVGAYDEVVRDLDAGRPVLFSGTGCQIAGVRTVAGERRGLVTCEVVCHGIPSLKAWRGFCREKEAQSGKKIADVVFRDKSAGWRYNQYRTVFDDGSEETEPSSRHPFHSGYLRGMFYRESCGACPYASLPRVADVTLADFWRYNGPLSSGADDPGTSLVVVNSPAGQELFERARTLLDIDEVDEAAAVASCRQLTRHPEANAHRREFLDELDRGGYFSAFRMFVQKSPNPRRHKSLWTRVCARLRRLRDDDRRRALRAYAAEMGRTAVFPGTIPGLLRLLFGRVTGAVVMTDRRRVRQLARRRGFALASPKKMLPVARRHLALRDAFLLLAKKGVSVWFCNRVGRIKTPDWRYADSAERRRVNGLSFPVMLKNISAHVDDLRELFGEKYSPEYVAGVGRIPQIVRYGEVFRHEDVSGRHVNVVGGLRVTCGQPSSYSRTLHVYGRCGAFGYAVEDADTLPSQLQKSLSDGGVLDVRVVNHGLWGGDDACLDGNFLHELSEFAPGDVVLFYRKHLDPALMEKWAEYGVRYLDITKAWHAFPEAKWCFYDRPGHMNAIGYAHVAQLISNEMEKVDLASIPVPRDRLDGLSTPWLTAWLKDAARADLSGEIDRYLAPIRTALPLLPSGGTAGAIVMNCNPFTYGHRHLIERAAGEVDRLYVFVVEEDKSFFKFADRLEMVKAGVADLSNVAVFPSGRFMISSLTFPEYFMKDYVKERDFDVSSDVKTFCERIAPRLGITVRFAGAEPFDPVTANYNACMAQLLPRHGIRFREVPRFEVAGRGVVNATEVRRLIAASDWSALEALVPPSTLEIVRARYAPKKGAS